MSIIFASKYEISGSEEHKSDSDRGSCEDVNKSTKSLQTTTDEFDLDTESRENSFAS